ncbi:hypothetical protein EDC01DRAFT_632348 [Geopyxis carbonaria]|nr:hypothetical protein EDC01DRAFT_632348 [Geopyxis carbonaria]
MSPPSSSPRLQPQPDLPPPLAWSTTLTLSPPTATSGGAVPAGDKIHLPQSALEQLLAAAASSSSSHLSTSTYYDNDGYASAESWARRAPPQQQQRNGDGLPHPLIVKLSNPANGVSVYAVPREFSADEGSVVVASFLRRALGLHDTPTDTPATPINLNIEAASLPKGTSVRLRPLEAGYDDEDWKAILERHLREGFATVQEGLVLEVPRGHGRGGVWRFLVDQALPGGTICVVDTDLEVTIEALDEAQARETLKRRLAKPTTGGKLAVGQEVAGAVAPGEEHFYELAAWDRGKPVQIVLDGDGEAAEWVDVFVATDLQHHKPRIGEYIWGDMGWVFPKTISIEPGNVALEGAKTVTVGIRGWRDPDEDGDGEAGEARGYTLRITQDPATIDLTSDDDDEDIKPDHTRCPNCRRQISSRTYILHSSHCARQILRCPQCPATFPRSSPLSKTHWHCALCTSSGPTATSHTKHLRTTHTPRPCPSCSHPTSSLPDLATHRTSTCPSKLHLPRRRDRRGSHPHGPDAARAHVRRAHHRVSAVRAAHAAARPAAAPAVARARAAGAPAARAVPEPELHARACRRGEHERAGAVRGVLRPVIRAGA